MIITPHVRRLAPTGALLLLALAALVSATLPAAARAATYPTGFEERTMVSGLNQPTSVTWTPDGRALITEKPGVLKIADPGSATATTLLDISNQVNDYNDRGMLDVAVDSSFVANQFIYVLYTREMNTGSPDGSGPMASRLTRYVLSPTNQLSSPTIILGSASGLCSSTGVNNEDCLPSEGGSHSIGTVRSAPDGTLYVGSGDASSYSMVDPLAYRTYSENSLAGKIMHIDRTGQGLSDHPFCPATTDLSLNCTKLYAKGFRNPFRFSLRPDGLGLTVGDVGWNTREEINLIRAGGKNYGWPCYEGTIRTPGYKDRTSAPTCAAEYAKEGTANADVDPKYDYVHLSGSAILGGPTYTGSAYPASYQNKIFIGDYAAGFVRALTVNAQDEVTSTQTFADNWAGVDLEPAPDNGDLVYASFGTGAPGTGSIKRVAYAPTNRTPTAVATRTPHSGPAPLAVSFSGSGSTDPDGDALTYTWNFGDGSPTATGVTQSHTYTTGGTYTATLTVNDGRGGVNSTTVQVGVNNSEPAAEILTPDDGTLAPSNQLINLSGRATDPEQGTLPAAALSWRVVLHHNDHTHPMIDVDGVASTSFTTRDDHDSDSYYEVILTATDSGGLQSTDTIRVNPKTVNLSLQSTPAGAPMTYSGLDVTAPYSRTSTIGYRTTISAATSFVKGGHKYVFANWSDGGTANHDVTIPSSNLTLTANYTDTGPVPPILALGFDDGTGTTAVDSSAFGNDGTLSNGAGWSTAGKYGKALSLDGVNDWVTVAGSDSLGLTSQMTLEAWVKPNSLTPWRTVMAKEYGNEHVWAMYAPGAGVGGHVEIGVFGLDSATPLANGTWMHIAMAYDDNTMRLYINGVLAGTRTGALPTFGTNDPLHIGGNSGWSDEFFDGLIDEVRIYDRALTSAEVNTDMNTPINGSGPPPDTTPPAVAITAPSQSATVSGTLNVAANATDASGIDRVQFKVDGNDIGSADTSSPYSVPWNSTTVADGTHHLTAVAYDTHGNQATSTDVAVTVDNIPDAGPGPKLALGFEAGSGTTAADSSGNGNTGTLSGASWTSAGKFGNALSFDGVNDWVTVADANSLDVTTAFTLEAWVKPRVNGQWDVIAMKEKAPTHSYALYATDGSALPESEVGGAGQNGTAALPTGVYSHVAMTYGSNTLRLYVNGTLVGSRSGVSQALASTGPLRIGGNAVFSGEWFDGSIDELRLYDRALTAPEISTDMQTPISDGGPPPDTTPPTVSVSAPAGGATVSGTTVALSADASDASGIQKVQLKVDGADVGSADTSSPYEASWNSTTVANGTHTVTAVATDNAGNVATSSSVSVNVNNGPPPDTTPPTVSVNAPAAGATVSGTTVGLGADASDAGGIASVQFKVDGSNVGSPDTSSPYGVNWDSTQVSNGNHTITAVATDTAGNAATSAGVSVNVSNGAPPDTTPPTVSVSAPANGATVAGTSVAVNANASDASGITQVQFRLDGNNLSSPDTSSPFGVTWNSTTVSNGTHKLTAVATDGAGNSATSAEVTVTVSNASGLSGLVLGLGFEAGSGTSAVDSSGSNNNGTISGATWNTGGRFGKALSFDGTNDLVTVADANSLDLTSALTLEAWIKPRVVGTWDSAIIKERPGGAAYVMYAADGGRLPETEIGPAGLNGPAALPSGAWSHLAVTYASQTLRIYVNGAQVASRSNVSATTASTGALRIGGNMVFTGEWFDGLIDEVRVYNRALTAQEVGTDMNAPVVSGTSGVMTLARGTPTKPLSSTKRVGRKLRVPVCTSKQIKKAKKAGKKPKGCVVPAKPKKK